MHSAIHSTEFHHKKRRLLSRETTRTSTDHVAALPTDVFDLMVQKLDKLSFQCMGAVSKYWRAMVHDAKKRQPYQFPEVPCLTISSEKVDHPTSAHHQLRLFSLSHKKILKVNLLQTCGRCCGSSWGWLVMEGEVGSICILSPFNSDIIIQLPKRKGETAVFRQFLSKAILLSLPTSNECVVVVLDIGLLSFCQLGDEGWTDILRCHGWIGNDDFVDIIFFKGEVYAVTYNLQFVHVELGNTPKLVGLGNIPNFTCCDFEPIGNRRSRLKTVYLVEHLGELLMVIRLRDYQCGITKRFEIFKFDEEIESWTSVESVGHYILFVGSANAVILSVLDYPTFKGNCIYFTEADEGLTDRGVFDLGEKNFKPLIVDNVALPISTSFCNTPILL